MRVKPQIWIISLAILLGMLALTHYAGVRNLLSSTLELSFLLPSASQGGEKAADSIETTSVVTASAKVPAFSHIFIIVLENKEAKTIVGKPAASYINSLAAQYGRAKNFYGITHPSLPNYLALTGGDTFGVTTNCKDCFIEADNLVNQLETAGRSWKAYMESMPGPCFVGDAPPFYRQKHNPFIYYNNVRTDPARCQKIVPFDQFAGDLKANTLPDFVWITPDMCNSMHDCTIGEGDKWLQTWVPQILASPAWQENGVLFITFDEGKSKKGCCTYAAGGKIDTLVVSPLVQPGFISEVPYDHYSLLRTIEMAWGLPLLGKANCDCSPPMSDFFAAAKLAARRHWGSATADSSAQGVGARPSAGHTLAAE